MNRRALFGLIAALFVPASAEASPRRFIEPNTVTTVRGLRSFSIDSDSGGPWYIDLGNTTNLATGQIWLELDKRHRWID